MALVGLDWDDITTPAQKAVLYALDKGDVPALRAALQTYGDGVLRARMECWGSIIDHVLGEAFCDENHSYLSMLLDAGLSPNFATDDEGRTLLIRAAFSGDEIACRLLLDRGADANAQDARGENALHYAADLVGGSLDEVRAEAIGRMLRDAGARVDVKGEQGLLPIDYARKAKEYGFSRGTADELSRFLDAFR
jgi:hypothetical protein